MVKQCTNLSYSLAVYGILNATIHFVKHPAFLSSAWNRHNLKSYLHNTDTCLYVSMRWMHRLLDFGIEKLCVYNISYMRMIPETMACS